MQGSQDARFAEVQPNLAHVHETTIPHSNLVQVGEFAKCLNTLELPALVVTRAMAVKSSLNEREEEAISIDSSEDSPHFSELNETTKQLVGDMKKKDMPSTIVEPDEGDYQFMSEEESWKFGHRHQGKINPAKAHNPAESYDLWQDLCKAKANISFGQLVQIAPSLRKEMKEGATNHRKPKNMSIAARVAPENNDLELNEREEDDVFGYGPVEIEVEVMDKIIPHVIVDDGSNVNIMPESTMLRLGLSITGPSPWKVKLADQRPSKPLGQIKDLRIRAGDEEYTVTFYVLRMHDEDGGYPLLLGRKWLRLAGGIVNWQAKTPYISFGSQDNRTIVPVLPHGPFKPKTFNMNVIITMWVSWP
jgi:hypothetical protein